MALNIQQEQKGQKEKVLKMISRMPDTELSSPFVVDSILKEVKVPMPTLDLTAGNVGIRSEMRIFNQKNPPPPDISFSPNEPTEVTIYRVPILHNLLLHKGEKQGHFITFTESHLEYTIYDSSLTVEQKRDSAYEAIHNFQNDLLAKRDAMVEFENGELKAFTESEVVTELQKRQIIGT